MIGLTRYMAVIVSIPWRVLRITLRVIILSCVVCWWTSPTSALMLVSAAESRKAVAEILCEEFIFFRCSSINKSLSSICLRVDVLSKSGLTLRGLVCSLIAWHIRLRYGIGLTLQLSLSLNRWKHMSTSVFKDPAGTISLYIIPVMWGPSQSLPARSRRLTAACSSPLLKLRARDK